MGFKIIDQPHGLKAELLRQHGSINNPGQIGSGDSPMQNRASNAKACQSRAGARIAQKNTEDFIQALVFAAGINLLQSRAEPARLLAEERDSGVRPTDVTGQNHSRIFLQERPSRVMMSSASFGPHEPAG